MAKGNRIRGSKRRIKTGPKKGRFAAKPGRKK
jgi:hypothetical protein